LKKDSCFLKFDAIMAASDIMNWEGITQKSRKPPGKIQGDLRDKIN
jgi:hypothetical protein